LLNRRLASHGFLRLSETPELYDQTTVAGLMAYQLERGLPATGQLDEETSRRMMIPHCGVRAAQVTLEGEQLQLITTARYVIQNNPWKNRRITYCIHNWPDEVTTPHMEDAAKTAFEWWRDALMLNGEPVVEFEQVDEAMEGDANIEITFMHDEAHPPDDDIIFHVTQPDGGTLLAHAYYPIAENDELAGEIHVNDLLNWDGASPDGYDLTSMLAHEIGHALGIGHIDDENCVMHADYVKLRTGLHDKDKEAIRDLYINGVPVYVSVSDGPEGGGPKTSTLSRRPPTDKNPFVF
jgi:Matrixin/Putative peptidoglycan binding domain